MSMVELTASTEVIVVSPADESVSVILAGPPGPRGAPGLSGDLDPEALQEFVDVSVAAHNQAETVHTNATSGRDFAALFENGLV